MMSKENYRDYFTHITPADVPIEVADKLLVRGELHIDQHQKPNTVDDFGELRYLLHDNGDRSYLADQTKLYHNGAKEDIIHVVDTSLMGQISGVGEIRFNRESDEDYFKEKPFVGMTWTEVDRRREGLATRRLLVMKLACAAEFGLALYSDTLMSEGAMGVWRRMVENGLAVSQVQLLGTGEETIRYRFK